MKKGDILLATTDRDMYPIVKVKSFDNVAVSAAPIATPNVTVTGNQDYYRVSPIQIGSSLPVFLLNRLKRYYWTRDAGGWDSGVNFGESHVVEDFGVVDNVVVVLFYGKQFAVDFLELLDVVEPKKGIGMKIVKVKITDLGWLHKHVACAKWQKCIETLVEESAGLFYEDVDVPEALVAEAFKEANADQKVELLKFFKEPVVQFDSSMLKRGEIMKTNGGNIVMRIAGEDIRCVVLSPKDRGNIIIGVFKGERWETKYTLGQ